MGMILSGYNVPATTPSPFAAPNPGYPQRPYPQHNTQPNYAQPNAMPLSAPSPTAGPGYVDPQTLHRMSRIGQIEQQIQQLQNVLRQEVQGASYSPY